MHCSAAAWVQPATGSRTVARRCVTRILLQNVQIFQLHFNFRVEHLVTHSLNPSSQVNSLTVKRIWLKFFADLQNRSVVPRTILVLTLVRSSVTGALEGLASSREIIVSLYFCTKKNFMSNDRNFLVEDFTGCMPPYFTLNAIVGC